MTTPPPDTDPAAGWKPYRPLLTLLFFGLGLPLLTLSFPSGHAMGAAALATAGAYLLWPTRGRRLAVVLGALWALGVGWSRTYLGVHYPSDVLAGWVASVASVSGVYLVFSRYFGQLRGLWQAYFPRFQR